MVFCKKITYQLATGQSPSVLLGIITKEDEHFFYFKTQKKEYVIGKNSVLFVSDTDIVFKEEKEE